MRGSSGCCSEVIVRLGRGESAVKERNSRRMSSPLSLLLAVKTCCRSLEKYSPISSSLRLTLPS